MSKPLGSKQAFAQSTSPYAMCTKDDGHLRVNVALTTRGLAMVCIAFDQRCGKRVSAPVLHMMRAEGASGRLTSTSMHPAGLRDDRDLRKALSQLLMGALSRGCAGSDPFVRHMTLALFAMNGGNNEGAESAVESTPGLLKPWQEKLAKDMLGGNLHNPVSLREVADACGLSASHFCRAFRNSVGEPPHRWVLMQRLERAKGLLMDPARTLTNIAFECGFCEQSHLTHVFSSMFGLSPGAWRKRYRPC